MLSRNLVLKEEEESIKDRMARDLAGFRLATGYYLEIAHSLMGFFPAIINETKELVISLDEKVLEDLKELLPKRRSRIKEISLLINEQESIAFDMAESKKTKENQYRLLTKKEFDNLKEKKGSFRWAR